MLHLYRYRKKIKVNNKRKIDPCENDYEDGPESEEDDPQPVLKKSGKNASVKGGDYVIVNYEGEFFPGVVVKCRSEEAQVSVMAMASISGWKWPKPKDILWYPNEDIRETIQEPRLLNSEGLYGVPEIRKY